MDRHGRILDSEKYDITSKFIQVTDTITVTIKALVNFQ